MAFAALGGLVLALVAVLARVVMLQISPPTELDPESNARQVRYSVEARRGDIVDRRGRVLASTVPGERLFVDPTRLEPPYMPTIEALAEVTGVDLGVVNERVMEAVVRNRRREAAGKVLIQHVRIGGALEPGQAELVRGLDLPGVHLQRLVRRVRAGESVAALMGSVLGLVSYEHAGVFGAEAAFDERLRGRDGHLRYVAAADGEPMWVEPTGVSMPSAGATAAVSLDLRLQEILVEELERAVEVNDAAGARGVVCDPHTGEILAMHDVVRTPEDAVAFDPDVASSAARGEIAWPRFVVIPDTNAPGVDREPALRRNRCVTDVYEPGSTFKPFVWASVTELGVFDPEDKLDTGGGVWRTPYGRRVEDVAKRGEQTWHDVLVNSSNVGMSKAAEELTHEQMQRAIRRFGFGEETNLRLIGERRGLLTPPERWLPSTQTSVSFGYEVAVTPLQMVRAFSVFARRGDEAGTLPELRLTADLDSSGVEARVRRRVLPRWVAEATRSALRDVGEKMDAMVRRRMPEEPSEVVELFGKSGTALLVRPDGRGYLPHQYCSSFVAASPSDDPVIVVLILVEDPGPGRVGAGLHMGSASAGPVVRRVVDRSLSYLGYDRSPKKLDAGR